MAAEHMSGDSICAFCARMKRGAMYSCMRKHGYNKLVLAQHLDDLVESFFMSVMHNGLIRTMKAAYVVRLLCFVFASKSLLIPHSPMKLTQFNCLHCVFGGQGVFSFAANSTVRWMREI